MPREPEDALDALVSLLKRAHAGELAAFLAYEGHWRSLRDPVEASEVRAIAGDELVHRREIGRALDRFGHSPAALREILFWILGRTIGALCRLGGWFAPMYGAGLLERGNIDQYERASELARAAGQKDLVEPLRRMAAVESAHERYFRSKVENHWLSRIVPIWGVPFGTLASPPVVNDPVSPVPARSGIRGRPAEMAFEGSRPVPVHRTSP